MDKNSQRYSKKNVSMPVSAMNLGEGGGVKKKSPDTSQPICKIFELQATDFLERPVFRSDISNQEEEEINWNALPLRFFSYGFHKCLTDRPQKLSSPFMKS